MKGLSTTVLTWVEQIASWAYAIGIFIVASQIGVDVVKVDPFTAAQKFVEVSLRWRGFKGLLLTLLYRPLLLDASH